MTKQKNIQDTLITTGLLILALIAVSSAGFVVQDTQPVSKTMREAHKKELASLKKQTIISHTEVKEGDETMVSYVYLGDPLPEKLAKDEVVELRKESSWTRQTGTAPDGKAIYESVVYPGPAFTKYRDTWYYLEYGKVSKKTFDEYQKPSIFSLVLPEVAHALSATEYGLANASVHAYGTTWASVQSTTTPFQGGAGTACIIGWCFSIKSRHHTNSGKFDLESTGFYIYRGFLTFDTSFIPYNSTISAASLNVYATSSVTNTDNDGSDYLTVVQTSQPSETLFTSDDYDLCGSPVTNPTEGIDAGQRKDISSITLGSYYTFTLNSTGRSWIKTNGQTSNCGSSQQYIIFTSSDSAWKVPYDWSSGNNTIEMIGGGGGGQTGATTTANAGGGGGGGGAYSKSTNVSLPPGGTITIAVGAAGAGDGVYGTAGTDGGDSYVCNSTSNCSSISGSAVVVGAKGGAQGTNPGSGTANGGGGSGGSSTSGVGSTKYSGGNGGNRNVGGGGGGGGAGGPNGNGGNGGQGGTSSPYPGGGGGGAGGGSNGSNGTTDGGAGGNGFGGTGGGAGGTGGGNGTAGTAGTGGGGGGGDGNASVGAGSGGFGAVETQWGSGYGPSGGGGGGGQTTCAACAHGAGSGGLGYGAGGGGGGGGVITTGTNTGFAGAQGIVVMQYANLTKGTTCLGIREGHDTTNSAITNDTTNEVNFTSIQAPGSQDPYLSITYTAPFAFWQFLDF